MKKTLIVEENEKSVDADPAFLEKFRNLQQVFIYITDNCFVWQIIKKMEE